MTPLPLWLNDTTDCCLAVRLLQFGDFITALERVNTRAKGNLGTMQEMVAKILVSVRLWFNLKQNTPLSVWTYTRCFLLLSIKCLVGTLTTCQRRPRRAGLPTRAPSPRRTSSTTTRTSTRVRDMRGRPERLTACDYLTTSVVNKSAGCGLTSRLSRAQASTRTAAPRPSTRARPT